MFKKLLLQTMVWYLMLLIFPAMVPAEAELSLEDQVRAGSTPVDNCMSLDGQLLFVLTRQGKLEIYSSDLALKENLSLDFPADRIAVSGKGDILYLTDSKTGDIRMIRVDFIQDIDIQGSPFKGPENGPVTIVIFTDFQCFYCAKAVSLLEEVALAYPDQVKIVLKNFPLSMHKSALPAAAAALAAHNQGKFWPMHDLLFDNSDSLTPEKIKECAQTLGLDMDRFNADQDSPKIQLKIHADLLDGREAGVRGTPTIFVNGRRLKRRTFQGFKTLIDEELKKQPHG
ncbi:DsbA family protein [Desulfospira joergensenii]|uniref:DsbA family protein n=1 Tax=Desulfospira joergensenii TaxID=53329 RepID=UPI0003B799A3|nr:thioredoxin domain-containing protein [Desulfospira joergensenii]